MRVSITDLYGRPGTTRPVDLVLPQSEVEELGDWGPLEGQLRSDVTLDLDLDSVMEGILVRGTIDWDVEVTCHRCLEPQIVEQQEVVAELFPDPAKARDGDEEPDEGYSVIDNGDAIDLSMLIRDTLVLNHPQRTPDHGCVGPADSDVGIVDLDANPPTDPRWADLAKIEVPPSAN